MEQENIRAELLKYKTYLTDMITGLPTMALEIENLRKSLSAIDNDKFKGVMAFIIVEVSNIVEDIAGWAVFDTIMKDIGYMFKNDYNNKKGLMKDIISIMVPAIRGNQFIFVLVKDNVNTRDKFLSEVTENLQNRIIDLLRNYVDTVSRDMINSGYTFITYDTRKRFERIIYDAYNKAYINLIKDKEKEIDEKFDLLMQIINGNMIETLYQPIVDLSSMQILGYEALSRVDSSLFPNSESLFSYAIETEYLYDLERLCRKNAILHIGDGLPTNKLLFLNNSARGIVDQDFINGSFLELLNENDLSVNYIVLELTERIAIENYEYYVNVLKKLKKEGYKIAIDDMGSGYSSMRTLAELKPDFLKYDINLVRDIHMSSIKQDLLKALVDVANTIGAKVIAEGIEKKEELDMIISLGVDYAQGYYLKMPKKSIVAVL